MEVIAYLVPELQNEMHLECGMQLFKKLKCFYVNFNVTLLLIT